MIIISATNVRGLGALKLVGTILVNHLPNKRYLILQNILNPVLETAHHSFFINKYEIPYVFFRIIEIFLLYKYIKLNLIREFVVLGDIPYYKIPNQIVLVHNPHIVKPFRKLLIERKYREIINRLIFRNNIRYVKKFIVQTQHMKASLIEGFMIKPDAVRVMSFPTPISISGKFEGKKRTFEDKKIILFYPSRRYPHKNHNLLMQIPDKNWDNLGIKIRLTINEEKKLQKKCINFLGELSKEEVVRLYKTSHVLLFLSKTETLGLPLIEAMYFNLFIIAPNLPYAKEICGDRAFYFEPNDIASLESSIRVVCDKIRSGSQPTYTDLLEKFHVAPDGFLEKMIDA